MTSCRGRGCKPACWWDTSGIQLMAVRVSEPGWIRTRATHIWWTGDGESGGNGPISCSDSLCTPFLLLSTSPRFLLCFSSFRSAWVSFLYNRCFKGRVGRVVFLATCCTVTVVAVVYCFCLLLFYCFSLIGP